jgi:hypothetical protein
MPEVEALESVVKNFVPKFERCVEEAVATATNEAEFREPIDSLLEEFCAKAKLDPLARSEYSLVTGRPDRVFNRLVIEYERPGALSEKLSQPSNCSRR